jgi:hypothetical protein
VVLLAGNACTATAKPVLLAVDGEPSVARKNVDNVGDDEAKKTACLASLIMSFVVRNHRLEQRRAAAARRAVARLVETK